MEGICGIREEERQETFQVCRALDRSAGVNIKGERQGFFETENGMVVAILLGGAGNGVIQIKG